MEKIDELLSMSDQQLLSIKEQLLSKEKESSNIDLENRLENIRPLPDITDLETVLKTEKNSTGKDFICRKGTSLDVFDNTKSVLASIGTGETET